MQERLLALLVEAALKYLSSEDVKSWLDSLIDKLEEKIACSETQLDDIAVLPFIKLFRATFDIPDKED